MRPAPTTHGGCSGGRHAFAHRRSECSTAAPPPSLSPARGHGCATRTKTNGQPGLPPRRGGPPDNPSATACRGSTTDGWNFSLAFIDWSGGARRRRGGHGGREWD